VSDGTKCERCWKTLLDVGTHSHSGFQHRCETALGQAQDWIAETLYQVGGIFSSPFLRTGPLWEDDGAIVRVD
jgi:hypothetical protein